MDIRSWFYSLVSNDLTLTGFLGASPNTRLFPVNVLTSTPNTPYAAYKLIVETPRIGSAKNAQLQVWVHDKPGDYSKIDSILARIKEVLEAQTHADDFLEARWLDHSEDMLDEGSGTITRFSRYTIIQSK